MVNVVKVTLLNFERTMSPVCNLSLARVALIQFYPCSSGRRELLRHHRALTCFERDAAPNPVRE